MAIQVILPSREGENITDIETAQAEALAAIEAQEALSIAALEAQEALSVAAVEAAETTTIDAALAGALVDIGAAEDAILDPTTGTLAVAEAAVVGVGGTIDVREDEALAAISEAQLSPPLYRLTWLGTDGLAALDTTGMAIATSADVDDGDTGTHDDEVDGAVSFTGEIATNQLTITVGSGARVGQVLSGTNVTAGSRIVSQDSGTTGGAGVYTLDRTSTAASTTITAKVPNAGRYSLYSGGLWRWGGDSPAIRAVAAADAADLSATDAQGSADDAAASAAALSATVATVERLDEALPELNDAVDMTGDDSRLGKVDISFQDSTGNFLAGLEDDGGWVAKRLRAFADLIAPQISTGQLTVDAGGVIEGADGTQIVFREMNYDFVICDENDYAILGLLNDQLYGVGSTGNSARDVAVWSANANLSRGQGIASTPHNVKIQKLDAAEYGLIAGLGQSLSAANETWPHLTRTAYPDTYMIGESVRPEDSYSNTFVQQGATADFQPLVATTEINPGSGRTPLSDGAIAALSPGDGAQGENPIVAITRQISAGIKSRLNAPATKLVAASAAIGGQSLEILSSGASGNLFNRNVDMADLVKSIADGLGKTSACAGVYFAQGETNYDGATFGFPTATTDKDTYKALLAQYRLDFNAAMATSFGATQALPPAWFIYATSGAYIIDSANMSISMAQVEFALETPGVWCVGPSNFVCDKGGHLNANGSRWHAALAGKVARRVLVEGLGHEPLYPVSVDVSGKYAYIQYAPMMGDLFFDNAYLLNAPTMYAGRGFRVEDDTGFLTFASTPRIIGGAAVEIELTTTPVGTTYVWCADKTVHGGNSNLYARDPARSDDVFEYLAASGMYAAENITELVDNPYPLHDPACPFRLASGYSR